MKNQQLNPHISVDCVIFGFDYEQLKVLLVQRNDSSKNYRLKLPGSLIRDDENLCQAATRVLEELTGLNNIYLKQFHIFGEPDRIKPGQDHQWLESTTKMKIKRVISVGYYALIKIDNSHLTPNAKWYPIEQISELAFDHLQILHKALDALRTKLKTKPVAFELLPEKFTIRQLQNVYECILGTQFDNRNFRKKIMSVKYIVPLKEKQKGVAHKPAQYFKFDKKIYLKTKPIDFGFRI